MLLSGSWCMIVERVVENVWMTLILCNQLWECWMKMRMSWIDLLFHPDNELVLQKTLGISGEQRCLWLFICLEAHQTGLLIENYMCGWVHVCGGVDGDIWGQNRRRIYVEWSIWSALSSHRLVQACLFSINVLCKKYHVLISVCLSFSSAWHISTGAAS